MVTLPHRRKAFRSSGAPSGGGGDPYFANVSLLAHMNGANNGTTFTDSSSYARTLTRSGGVPPVTSTAESKFNGSSGYFNAYGRIYAADSSDFTFGTGDFTIEFFYRWSNLNGVQAVYDRGWTASGALLIFAFNTSGKWIIYASGGQVLQETSASSSTGVWYHYAIVRSGTTLTIYRDGVAAGSVTNSTNFNVTGATGIGSDSAGNYGLIGHLAEYRVTKGVARYTSSFSPPTEAYPDS